MNFDIEDESAFPSITLSILAGGDPIIARRGTNDLNSALAHVGIHSVMSAAQ